jgi:hypothetical protein
VAINVYTHQLIKYLRFLDSHIFPESPSEIVGLELPNEESYQYEDPLMYISDIHESWFSGLKARLVKIPELSLDIPHLYIAWAKGIEKDVKIFLEGKHASKGYFQLLREMAATRVWKKVRFRVGPSSRMLNAEQIYKCLPLNKKQACSSALVERTMKAFPNAHMRRENASYKFTVDKVGPLLTDWLSKVNGEAMLMGSLFNRLHNSLFRSEQESINFFKKCQRLIQTTSRPA